MNVCISECLCARCSRLLLQSFSALCLYNHVFTTQVLPYEVSEEF